MIILSLVALCVVVWIYGEFTHECEFDYGNVDYTKKDGVLTIGFYRCKHKGCNQVDCAVIGDDNERKSSYSTFDYIVNPEYNPYKDNPYINAGIDLSKLRVKK